MKFRFQSFAIFAVAVFFAAEAFAQLGSIRGKFIDEDGNPVADLECTIEPSSGGGRKTTGKTKNESLYSFWGDTIAALNDGIVPVGAQEMARLATEFGAHAGGRARSRFGELE